MSQFELNFVHDVIFENVPLAWTTRFEFFTHDLEQFPLMYVHRKIEPIEDERLESPIERVYGFPLNATIVDDRRDGDCTISVKFLCNAPQGITSIDEVVFEELNHRLGLANKVTRDDLDEICQKAPVHSDFLQALWMDRIDCVFGDAIPHGKIFDEVFGIIRFSASGQSPRLGKVSELRMTYWYAKEIGEPVIFGSDLEQYNFCEFYLLPSMEELRNLDFTPFPNFSIHYKAICKIWESEYNETFTIGTHEFRFAPNLPH